MTTVRLGDGRSVRLGRIRPQAISHSDRFTVVVLKDGSIKVRPRFSAHRNPHARAGAVIVTNWLAKCQQAIAEMYGNDSKGDCVIASILKRFGGWTGNDTGKAALSSDSEALQTYTTVCGPGDNGCVITDVLDYAKSKGIPMGGVLHKIDGYVSIDTANQQEVAVAVDVFGPCMALGLNIPQSWVNAVGSNGFVWDVVTDPAVGGHDVPVIDVNEKGVVIGTWARFGTITWRAMADKAIVEEAWAQLAPDWYGSDKLAPNGINAASLAADLTMLGNGTIPPVPGPPTPPPSSPWELDIVLKNGVPAGRYATTATQFPTGSVSVTVTGKMPDCSIKAVQPTKMAEYVLE